MKSALLCQKNNRPYVNVPLYTTSVLGFLLDFIAQKIKFSIGDLDLVTFTEETLTENFIFCAVFCISVY